MHHGDLKTYTREGVLIDLHCKMVATAHFEDALPVKPTSSTLFEYFVLLSLPLKKIFSQMNMRLGEETMRSTTIMLLTKEMRPEQTRGR